VRYSYFKALSFSISSSSSFRSDDVIETSGHQSARFVRRVGTGSGSSRLVVVGERICCRRDANRLP
jgi:hypothetical protein